MIRGLLIVNFHLSVNFKSINIINQRTKSQCLGLLQSRSLQQFKPVEELNRSDKRKLFLRKERKRLYHEIHFRASSQSQVTGFLVTAK